MYISNLVGLNFMLNNALTKGQSALEKNPMKHDSTHASIRDRRLIGSIVC